MKSLLLSLIVFLFFSQLNAQITFEKTFGDSTSNEIGNCVIQISSGEIFILGVSDKGGENIFLTKTDINGNELWTKRYSGHYDAFPKMADFQITKDSEFIIVGQLNRGVIIIRTDRNGDTIWTKQFKGGIWTGMYSVQQTFDEGFIFSGADEGSDGYTNIEIIKLKKNGDTQWDRFYNVSWYDDIGRSIIQTSDSGYVIGGNSWNTNGGRDDFYLLKIDSLGNKLWDNRFRGPDYDYCYDVKQNNEGQSFLVGYSTGPGAPYTFIVKTNNNGDTILAKSYIGGAAYSFQETIDGGYIIAGTNFIYSMGNFYKNGLEILKLDSNANLIWEKSYKKGNQSEGYSIKNAIDGGYIIVGYAFKWNYNFSHSDYDVYLIKTDSNGNVLTSIPEKNFSNQTKIIFSPNPFTTSTTLRITNAEQGKINYELKIYDLLGKIVHHQTVNSQQETLNLNLPSGIYFYKLTNEKKEMIANGKLVVVGE